MDHPSITRRQAAVPPSERRDEDAIETVRRAAALEDLARSGHRQQGRRARGSTGSPTCSTYVSAALPSDLLAMGWGRPAAWMTLGVLGVCGVTGALSLPSRETAAARDPRPSGERPPEGTHQKPQQETTAAGSDSFRGAEAWRERHALDDDPASAGGARRMQKRRGLDEGCPARVTGTEAGHTESRQHKPAAETQARPPGNAAHGNTEPAPSRTALEKPASQPSSGHPTGPNDSPVLP